MSIPAILIISIFAVELAGCALYHGKPRNNKCYSFYQRAVDIGVLSALLAWGGFFNAN